MKVGRIYKINVGVALLYFVIVLATTILTMIMGVANQNNMALRIILCTCFSILMIFISFENYKDGKSIFDKRIESKIIKTCIIFYYIFLALSTMFYIYESIAQYKANGAYIMVAATTIMLDVVNRSIHKENFDNSKMVWGTEGVYLMKKNKTYGNILIIGIIGLMLYNIGYGVGTAIYRIFGWLVIVWWCTKVMASNFMFDVITIKG